MSLKKNTPSVAIMKKMSMSNMKTLKSDCTDISIVFSRDYSPS